MEEEGESNEEGGMGACPRQTWKDGQGAPRGRQGPDEADRCRCAGGEERRRASWWAHSIAVVALVWADRISIMAIVRQDQQARFPGPCMGSQDRDFVLCLG